MRGNIFVDRKRHGKSVQGERLVRGERQIDGKNVIMRDRLRFINVIENNSTHTLNKIH